MSQTTRFPIMKKQLIDSQVSGGRCYVRLLPLISCFGGCDVQTLEEGIIEMTRILRRNPRGIDVLAALWRAEEIMSGKEDSALGLDIEIDPAPYHFIERIMASPVRFGFEDMNGVMHVTYYIVDENQVQDPDSPIQTVFGWAARFIIQQMCNADTRIGADDELDDLFGSMLDVPQDNIKTFDQPSMKLYSDDHQMREAQSRVEDSFNRLEARNSQLRPQVVDQNAELLLRLTRMEERMQSILSIKESVLPDDSSSNIGRYSKSYMRQGPVNEPIEEESDNLTIYPAGLNQDQVLEVNGAPRIYSVGKSGTVLQTKQEIYRPNVVKDIAVGFQRTSSMCSKEQKVLKTIHPINGLTNPFKSNRLNLLIHFHTAIENVLPNCGRDQYIEMMKYMVKYQAKTPSEELAYQIVSKTFDMSNLEIIANPFRLPFIEVGMQVNDSTLVKCFTMLEIEYKQLWFDQMKHLWVPTFHNEFNKYKESKMSGFSKQNVNNLDSSKRYSDRKKGHFERPSKTSNKTSTILSFR